MGVRAVKMTGIGEIDKIGKRLGGRRLGNGFEYH